MQGQYDDIDMDLTLDQQIELMESDEVVITEATFDVVTKGGYNRYRLKQKEDVTGTIYVKPNVEAEYIIIKIKK